MPSHTAKSEETAARATPAAARPAENDLRGSSMGFTTSEPAIRKTGALTAAKSQSMSTRPCKRYAGSARPSASSGSVGRRAPRASASIATRKRTRPTAPVSERNWIGRSCGSSARSVVEVR